MRLLFGQNGGGSEAPAPAAADVRPRSRSRDDLVAVVWFCSEENTLGKL